MYYKNSSLHVENYYVYNEYKISKTFFSLFKKTRFTR